MTRSKEDGGFDPSGFGGLLRAIRVAVGVSQTALAAKVGVHKQTLSKLERGMFEPGWPLVLLLARALGKTPNDFLPAEPKPEKKSRKRKGAE